jgi:hypothetical protein
MPNQQPAAVRGRGVSVSVAFYEQQGPPLESVTPVLAPAIDRDRDRGG